MAFLHGKALTAEMRRLVSKKGTRKLAIAYWGKDALKLLKLDPKDKDIFVICCLKGRKSDPDVIKQFKKRVRQCDNLHAKVVWSKDEAIVGSANASATGMPSEDNLAAALIEAGMLTKDRKMLYQIETWFDGIYKNNLLSRPVTKSDLEAAKKIPVAWPSHHNGKLSLIDAIKEGGRNAFRDERILFVMYRENTTALQDKSARGFLKSDATGDESKLNIGLSDVVKINWYTNYKGIPNDAFLIDCHYKKNTEVNGIYRTFLLNTNRHIQVNGGKELFTFAVQPKYANSKYKLTKQDVDAIKLSADELWKNGSGDDEGKIIPLTSAIPILLKHA
jgi:hypothetical protein